MPEKETEYLVMPENLEWETLTPVYGKVAIYPLERGFATTLGNSLRRVLLSSIPGAAITSVKIEGVEHRFSSIPGVVEDVPEVIANLKQVIIKLSGEDGKAWIETKEKGEVRAEDIKGIQSVEIFNLHLHIATLNGNVPLKMEVEVKKGKGYVPAEKFPGEDLPIGTIPIDALFSPINRVTFNAEDTRVGEKTDYEKLILELWTNGSITPEEAFKCANKILIQHQLFLLKGKIIEEEEAAIGEEKAGEKGELLSKEITDFDLSVRTSNCLNAANIKTLGDLAQKTREEMLQTKNFGKKCLQELEDLLGSMNLSFGSEEESGGKVPEEKGGGKEEAPGDLLNKKIADFDLSVRTSNCLDSTNLKVLGDLTQKTEKEMLQIKNLGNKSLQELQSLLEKQGLAFRKEE